MPQLTPQSTLRRRLTIRGQVQGVGFRPFIYRLASECGLTGFVANDGTGASVEIEGPAEAIARFEQRLQRELPPLARITDIHSTPLQPQRDATFRIVASQADSDRRPEVTPDAGTCADCLRELFDPHDRRYRYSFINCTNCGPRYSIIRDVPYDRPATTMAAFAMCPACQAEYENPADRRFHAQPNACPICGPRLRLMREGGAREAEGAFAEVEGDPIQSAVALLREGRILAIKGLGGFHLACRADSEAAVQELRRRKLRDGKPLAMMVADLAAAAALVHLTEVERTALQSPAAPIVLAPRRAESPVAASVAPGCHTLGVMLPYTPLHHLLFREDLGPLVMTSANISGEPLTFRDADALAGLADVADAFLLHDREIFRPIDDSVVFASGNEITPIRRARGYAPQPLRLRLMDAGGPVARVRQRRILAVGGELKSAVCLLHDGQAILSEHLGDLGHPAAYRHFVQAIDRLCQLFAFEPEVLACDLHPRYQATLYARGRGLPYIEVQHHHAHIASVMAEWDEPGPVVGLSCDGTGYGVDGAIWGGEVLVCRGAEMERAGHFAYFPLVGGDAAARETWRPAAALLRQAFGADWRQMADSVEIAPDQARTFDRQADAGLNAPPTSSLGRVFDAISFLLGLCHENRHEAEAAMALEAAAGDTPGDDLGYEITNASGDGALQLSLAPAVEALVARKAAGASVVSLAAAAHETISQMLATAAVRTAQARRIDAVALSGGCFANRRLLARVVELLEAQGLRVLYQRQAPSGDGGLSLGQALIAAWQLQHALCKP